MSVRFIAVALLFVGSVVFGHAENIGVLIRFGHTDRQPANWDGSFTVSSGKIASLEGWRFEGADAVLSESAWKADTRALSVRKTRGNNPQKLGANKKQGADQAGEPMADNGVIAQFTGVAADTLVMVKTTRGEFSFKLDDLTIGAPLRELEGAISVERVTATQALTNADNRDHDYPAIATDMSDGTWR
ncbi:MAG: hypothetical protein K8R87_04470 [Verrucomicrobia bacterium]|nr:hypothetical protein [Verrucomicrobiota bacterium]